MNLVLCINVFAHSRIIWRRVSSASQLLLSKVCVRACSTTSLGKLVCTPALSLKVARNPWSTTSTFLSRITAVIVNHGCHRHIGGPLGPEMVVPCLRYTEATSKIYAVFVRGLTPVSRPGGEGSRTFLSSTHFGIPDVALVDAGVGAVKFNAPS